MGAIRIARAYLREEGRLAERRRRSLSAEVFALASGRAREHSERTVAEDPELRLCSTPSSGAMTHYLAVQQILERVFQIGRNGEPRAR